MRTFLIRRYGKENVIATKDFIVAKGDIPVGLVAHADTVFVYKPEEIYYDKEANVMWSPEGLGADDRAGIYAIIQILNGRYRPHVIITTDEESGCIGSTMLVKKFSEKPFDELKFLIQLDRRGTKDSVYYDCANHDFETFINDFDFETNWGTLSDISVLAPFWGVAAVNLSVGYQDEHTMEERLFVGALFDTIEKVKKILAYVRDNEVPVYEYIEDLTTRYYRKYSAGWKDYDEYWWDDGYDLHKITSPDKCQCAFCGETDNKAMMLEIFYKPNYAIDLCNDCYSKYYDHIEWCCNCQKGWYMTEEEMNAAKGDRKMWLCRECREDKSNEQGNSGTNEPSDSVFPRPYAFEYEYGRDNEDVGGVQVTVPEVYEWSGL